MPASPVPIRHRAKLPPTRPPPARCERCHRSHLATSTSLCVSPILQAAETVEHIDAPRRLACCSVGSTSPCPFPDPHACHLQARNTRRTPAAALPLRAGAVPPPRHSTPPSRRCGCLRTPGRSASSPKAHGSPSVLPRFASSHDLLLPRSTVVLRSFSHGCSVMLLPRLFCDASPTVVL